MKKKSLTSSIAFVTLIRIAKAKNITNSFVILLEMRRKKVQNEQKKIIRHSAISHEGTKKINYYNLLSQLGVVKSKVEMQYCICVYLQMMIQSSKMNTK